VGEGVTDAAGTPLVAEHAVRSAAAHSDAAIQRQRERGIPTRTIIS
jgi:hypothetical protein